MFSRNATLIAGELYISICREYTYRHGCLNLMRPFFSECVSIEVVNSETHLVVPVTNNFTLNNVAYRVDISLTALGTNEMVALPPLYAWANKSSTV